MFYLLLFFRFYLTAFFCILLFSSLRFFVRVRFSPFVLSLLFFLVYHFTRLLLLYFMLCTSLSWNYSLFSNALENAHACTLAHKCKCTLVLSMFLWLLLLLLLLSLVTFSFVLVHVIKILWISVNKEENLFFNFIHVNSI